MFLGTRDLEQMRMLLWKMQLDALLGGTLTGKEHDFSNTQRKGEMKYIDFLEGRRGYNRREPLEGLVKGEHLPSLASDQITS